MSCWVVKLAVIAALSCASVARCDEALVQSIDVGVRRLLKNGRKTLELQDDIVKLQEIENVRSRNVEVCKTCRIVVGEMIQIRRYGLQKDDFGRHATNLCILFNNWDKDICKSFVNIVTPVILSIIDNRKNLTEERVCSIYLQHLGCSDPKRVDWNLPLPPRPNPDDLLDVVEIAGSNATMKVLHLTDFHYDPNYQNGSNARCDKLLCCQKDSGAPKKPEDAAGFWGDYRVCDIPRRSVEDALVHINTTHTDADYVYFTGDIIAHRSWDTTMDSNEKTMKEIFRMLRETFGNKTVYPVLGNHEAHPTNFWINSQDKSISSQWLFDFVADEWSKWLPKETMKTIKKGGYYTLLIQEGLRLIALNSNVCYTDNLWLFYDDVDPFGQLKWLIDTLAEAEKKKESVHIISHVPPGDKFCLANWNEVYNKIVDRFADTIRGQFNGHTHLDEFRLHYSSKNKSRVVNVAFNGGSLTTFVGFNPNYRLYHIDQDTKEVSDYDQWYYSMAEANLASQKKPNWQKLYSFKEIYGLSSMKLDELGGLVNNMEGNSTLQRMYYQFEVRKSAAAEPCDEKCLKGKICTIRSTHFADAINC
ncbi:PREDICTED: sphingomyelin phosphodiesterase-like [Nicrophorus vespilloides]|uniref:Sphingomyelin phosphodiesterase n=1 Tax=Nicrophorus vespilloides TaxID=110193 RepID=A0ABM1MCI4_NICVS|nr:PREDICTED: sphingomyelin phosphodiesterase-like [Nicrophorus vespilloides]